MIIDELRVIGSPQTNVVMGAEVIRVAQRVLNRRPPTPRKEGLGQLIFPYDAELAAALVAYMRTPTRIVWDCYRSTATRLEPLYDELFTDMRADARQLGFDGEGLSVEVRRVGEFAAGERQIVGTVKNALIDAAARRGVALHVDPDRYDALWVARLDEEQRVVVSRDLGGRSLSQRGWRLDQGEAPLREHLAAVLLMLCRYDPRRDVLVDPMCGSGTIPIEAALAARGVPRPLPATVAPQWRWPAHREPMYPQATPLVIGCDLDVGVLAKARDNGKRAQIGPYAVWQRGDVAALTPELIGEICDERKVPRGPGLLICNPPYGERLDPDDLFALYQDLAESARRFTGWRIGILTASPLIERAFGSWPAVKKPLANGPLRSYFYLWQL
jgi:putative N6-adenine-specific DNA methylase